MQRHEKPNLTPDQIKAKLQTVFGDKENYITFNKDRQRGAKLTKHVLTTTNVTDLAKMTDEVSLRVKRSGTGVTIIAYQYNC